MRLSIKINHMLSSIRGKKVSLKLWVLFSIVATNFVPVAAASDATLNLKPAQCIAIHQGKTCYVYVKLRWQAQDEGEYCLYSSQQSKPLKCWIRTNSGQFEREIVARKNVLFHLQQTKSGSVIVSKELEMAWIYKRNAKARASWRMF